MHTCSPSSEMEGKELDVQDYHWLYGEFLANLSYSDLASKNKK